MSATKGLFQSSIPTIIKLVKGFNPETVDIDIIVPGQKSSKSGMTFNGWDTRGMTQWLRNPTIRSFEEREVFFMEERIMQAAFIDPTTNIVYPVGNRHQIQPLLAQHIPLRTIELIVQKPNQGFVTDKGRWISRATAAEVGLDKRGHEMDSGEIPKAHDFDINEPVHQKLAWKTTPQGDQNDS